MATERLELFRFSPSVISALAVLFFFTGAARAQIVPYITDVVGVEGIRKSTVRGASDDGELSLIGTFKLFNPDTVPFYLWVSFENGGKFTKTRGGHSDHRSPSIRLIDMEFHYRDPLQRPIVKVFPKRGAFGGPPVRRSGWGSSSSPDAPGHVGRFGKKKPNERPSYGRQSEDIPKPDVSAASSSGLRHRSGGGGAVEIVFWREDVQPYYEMELWGVLYAPDVQAALAAGRYIENINFEIEPAR